MTPTRDWFNFATDLVINGIYDIDKSVDDVLAACESEEKLEATLDTFLARYKEYVFMLSRKKFNCSTMIKYGGHILDTTEDEIIVRPDPKN